MKTLPIIPFLLFAVTSFGATYTNVVNPIPSATLGWDAYTGQAQGFNLYYGVAPRTYTNRLFIAGQAATSVTLSNLAFNTTYYFSLTATNNGLESAFSNEVTNTTPTIPASPSGFRLTSATLILQFGP